MTSRARQGSRLLTAYDTGGLGMRNRIINGDMRINQRQFTAAGVNTDQYPEFQAWLAEGNEPLPADEVTENIIQQE